MADPGDVAVPETTIDASHARLEGARIAARGIAHCVNNDLTGALGNLSVVLLEHPDLPPAARQRLEQATAYLHRANAHLEDFQRIVRVATRDTPGGPILNLDASLQAEQP